MQLEQRFCHRRAAEGCEHGQDADAMGGFRWQDKKPKKKKKEDKEGKIFGAKRPLAMREKAD